MRVLVVGYPTWASSCKKLSQNREIWRLCDNSQKQTICQWHNDMHFIAGLKISPEKLLIKKFLTVTPIPLQLVWSTSPYELQSPCFPRTNSFIVTRMLNMHVLLDNPNRFNTWNIHDTMCWHDAWLLNAIWGWLFGFFSGLEQIIFFPKCTIVPLLFYAMTLFAHTIRTFIGALPFDVFFPRKHQCPLWMVQCINYHWLLRYCISNVSGLF